MYCTVYVCYTILATMCRSDGQTAEVDLQHTAVMWHKTATRSQTKTVFCMQPNPTLTP